MKNRITTLSVLSVCISMALNAQAGESVIKAADSNAKDEAICPADVSALSPLQLSELPARCLDATGKPLAQNTLMQWVAQNQALTIGAAAALAGVVAVAAGSGGGGGGNSGGDEPAREDGTGGDIPGGDIPGGETPGGEVPEEEKPEEEEKPKDPISDYDGFEQGNTIIGDGQANDLKDDVAAGAGQVGNLIGGDGTSNNLEGNQDVTDGGKGTVVVGDDTSTVIGGETIVGGEGSVGTEIVGDNAEVIKDGGSEVGSGGTGTIVIGDGANVGNKGETIVGGEGSAGTVVEGNNGEVVNDGNTEVSDGGTGTIVIGDGANVGNKGETIVGGEGSAGTIVEGNNGEVVNDGNTEISDGGTGTIVKGDDAVVGNKGDTSVGGAGSAGTIVEGNNGEVVNEGSTEVIDGGTGTIVRGDNGTVENIGDTTVGGEGSAGVVVEGNNGSVSQKGDLVVEEGGTGVALRGDNGSVSLEGSAQISAGSTGVIVEGNNADIRNAGDITVLGAGAAGMKITSHDARLTNTGNITVSEEGTGVVLAGDRFNATLDGNLLLDAGDKRLSAEGVQLSGSGGSLTIKGNVEVRDVLMTVAGVKGNLNGVKITGNANTVNIDGALSVNYKADANSRPDSASTKKGVLITGDDNRLNILGGVNLNFDQGMAAQRHGIFSAVQVAGDRNTVSVSGSSEVTVGGSLGQAVYPVQYFDISGNENQVLLHKDFRLTFKMTNGLAGTGYTSGIGSYLFKLSGENNYLVNEGEIGVDRGGVWAVLLYDKASAVNKGKISYAPNKVRDAALNILVRGYDSEFINDQEGVITVISAQQPYYLGVGGSGEYIDRSSALVGIGAANSIINNEGTINVSGQGAHGIIAGNNANVVNSGLITLNAMSNDLDADGKLLTETGLYSTATDYNRGTAVIANRASAVVTNTGEIRVHNAGMGMVANNGTVWNKGTITLTADNDKADALYAMAALGDGVAINDTDGVINIETDKGFAFYKTGNGRIINRGTVNFGGSEIGEDSDRFGAASYDGDTSTDAVIAALGETNHVTSSKPEAVWFLADNVANHGTVSADVALRFYGTLHNTGSLSSTAALSTKNLLNEGTLEAAQVSASGTLFNTGELTSTGGVSSAGFANQGTLNADSLTATGTLYNTGALNVTGTVSSRNTVNEGTMTVGRLMASAASTVINRGSLTGTRDGTPVVKNYTLWNEKGATITNAGASTSAAGYSTLWQSQSTSLVAQLYNYGDMIASNGFSVAATLDGKSGTSPWIYNMETGRMSGVSPKDPLINMGRYYNFYNAGEVTVQGDNAVAVSTLANSTETSRVVNAGVINVGTATGQADGSNGSGLTGIRAGGNGAVINNMQGGVINVYADNSYAFARASGAASAQIINNGEVNLLCDSGCGIIASGALNSGDDLAVTLPGKQPDISAPGKPAVPAAGNVSGGVMTVSGYTVGTNSDGSAGRLSAKRLAFGEGVKVDTGFTAGTASKSVTLNDVFKAASYSGQENIGSESVVWKASAQQNAAGNLDVKMEKQDYAAVASDRSQSSLASALDRAYTNNALFNSLNVSTSAALSSALKQVSGAQAKGLNREARVIGQRFTMLADSAPQVSSTGLSFNVVARGDKRAEMDNKVSYDMMALAQKFDTGFGSLTASYGMARLTGSGGNDSTRAGDNGLTGGYSQFLGLGHSLAFGENSSWDNSVRLDMHQLDSRRSIRFEGVNRTATASGKQQQLQLRSEMVKTLDVAEGLSVKPFAGMKLRHNVTGGYQESGAGDFNLSQNRYSETAVDVVTGLRLNYAGSNGWAAHATLEAGPNLSYSQSARKASLQGLQGQQFSVNDGKKAGGINGQAVTGVSYSSGNTTAGFNAFHWQEDGAADKGLMLNFSRHF